jgi:hypothetical protein
VITVGHYRIDRTKAYGRTGKQLQQSLSTDGSPSDSHPLKSGIVLDPCVVHVIVLVRRCDFSLAAVRSALSTRVDPVLLLFGRPDPITKPAAEWLRGHLPGSDNCR